MTTKNSLFVAIITLFVLSSCGDKPYYIKAVSFDDQVWNVEQKPEFKVNITDTTKPYTFKLVLRTTTDYGYNNLWVFLNTIAPDGSKGREPYQLRIANEDGSWVGERSGSIVETELSFAPRKLPLAGDYTFIVEQAITKDEVDEVLDLVFEVDELK